MTAMWADWRFVMLPTTASWRAAPIAQRPLPEPSCRKANAWQCVPPPYPQSPHRPTPSFPQSPGPLTQRLMPLGARADACQTYPSSPTPLYIVPLVRR